MPELKLGPTDGRTKDERRATKDSSYVGPSFSLGNRYSVFSSEKFHSIIRFVRID